MNSNNNNTPSPSTDSSSIDLQNSAERLRRLSLSRAAEPRRIRGINQQDTQDEQSSDSTPPPFLAPRALPFKRSYDSMDGNNLDDSKSDETLDHFADLAKFLQDEDEKKNSQLKKDDNSSISTLDAANDDAYKLDVFPLTQPSQSQEGSRNDDVCCCTEENLCLEPETPLSAITDAVKCSTCPGTAHWKCTMSAIYCRPKRVLIFDHFDEEIVQVDGPFCRLCQCAKTDWERRTPWHKRKGTIDCASLDHCIYKKSNRIPPKEGFNICLICGEEFHNCCGPNVQVELRTGVPFSSHCLHCHANVCLSYSMGCHENNNKPGHKKK